MFGIDYGNVILDATKTLEAALSTNPKTQQALQGMVRKVLWEARAQVVNAIKFDNGDPRKTRESIRTITYRKILGGDINILNRRRASGVKNTYEAPRPLRQGQRGGNRRTRSERTKTIQGYGPFDREFIMRFVNSGTSQRFIGFRNANSGERKRYESTRYSWLRGDNRTGNRGFIVPRNFFRTYGENALSRASDRLSEIIENELSDMLNAKK